MTHSLLLEKLERCNQSLQAVLDSLTREIDFSNDTNEDDLPDFSEILEERGVILSHLMNLLGKENSEQNKLIVDALEATYELDKILIEVASTQKVSVRNAIVKVNKAPKNISYYTNNK